jgi:hypothetical protein
MLPGTRVAVMVGDDVTVGVKVLPTTVLVRVAVFVAATGTVFVAVRVTVGVFGCGLKVPTKAHTISLKPPIRNGTSALSGMRAKTM